MKILITFLHLVGFTLLTLIAINLLLGLVWGLQTGCCYINNLLGGTWSTHNPNINIADVEGTIFLISLSIAIVAFLFSLGGTEVDNNESTF